ncbi:hypothetical protein [Actinoplanes sp. NPDC049599]|uniref:hypothetical protein n=1 Tax=Actinoplanes sp. NPDC049599 TaxID=3363903 RepID=UPI00379E976B
MTESTSTHTHSRFRDRWRALNMGDKAGVISAVLAALTAVAAGGSWAWKQTTGPEDKPATPAAPTAAPAANAPLTTAPTGTAPPVVSAGTPLDTVSRVGGEVTALPDELTAADYSRPVVVECPSNETGDQARTLTYDLDRRFRTFTATVSGWAETRNADPVEVRVYTKIRQPDDTFRTLEVGVQQSVVNEAGRALSAKVTGTDQLLVEVACHRPGGVVILDGAALGN